MRVCITYRLLTELTVRICLSKIPSIDTAQMEPLYLAWRKCVRRIFALPYNTHCNLLPNIAQDTSIDFKLQQRFCKFIQNTVASNNKCIKICVNLVAVGSKFFYLGHGNVFVSFIIFRSNLHLGALVFMAVIIWNVVHVFLEAKAKVISRNLQNYGSIKAYSSISYGGWHISGSYFPS